MKAVVDRIEGVVAVVQAEGWELHVPLWMLPAGTEGGDHLEVTITQDPEARAAEQARAEGLLDSLRGTKP